ncbi:MAG: potassium-transporting ATPase subunit KdpA [Anaerolineae bacterium]
MTFLGILQILIFFALVTALVKPVGAYMAKVFNGERTFLSPILVPVERVIYAACGVKPEQEQHWTTYTVAMLLFNVVGLLLLYFIERFQQVLPLNPQGLGPLAPDLAFNTAVSFTTNTNWQNYVPESTMSYLTQMAGLTMHNFISAATGIALAIALIRGFARHSAQTVGNFWADLVRCTLYILLPVSIILAIVFVWQGVPQNLNAYTSATTLEGAAQTIAQGPVASQEAIKMFGTNGGGFFNANSAHPYENPTPLSNFLQLLSIFAIGAGLTYTLGKMVGNTRQGWALYAAMAVLFIIGVAVAYPAEAGGNPLYPATVNQAPSAMQAGGNMEGKEVRFGIADSALFAVVTTDASCGAVNSMHDSYMPIGGMIPLVNIMLGEVIFGGVGAGMYGMLLFAILAVFVAGLMVGRTPEYLGKKIESREMKMTMLAVLITPLFILVFTGIASATNVGTQAILNPGPHGFSEILYAFTSAAGNNGSAFAGLSGNTLFYNVTGAVTMLAGRFWMIIPTLAIAGSLARKKMTAPTAGTFPTTGALFVGLLVGVVLIIGGLTFFPALSLGPIVEHFMLVAGHTFAS